MYEVTISPVLHVLSGDVLRFGGPADECPAHSPCPGMRSYASCRVKLEGIRYHYQNEHLEISLFA
jgi:hypothetical protein